MNKLKNCPFCGNLPSIKIETEKISGLVRYSGTVFCNNVDCHVQPQMKFSDSSLDTVYNTIIKYWNKRENDFKPIPPNTKDKDEVSLCYKCSNAEFGPDGTYCYHLGKNVFTGEVKDCDGFKQEDVSGYRGGEDLRDIL